MDCRASSTRTVACAVAFNPSVTIRLRRPVQSLRVSNHHHCSPFTLHVYHRHPFFHLLPRFSPYFTTSPRRLHSNVYASTAEPSSPPSQAPLSEPTPENPLLHSSSSTSSNGSNTAAVPPPSVLTDISSTSTDINQSIAKIALPALGTLALDPLVALADMACVGYLGATALGGVGIGNNVFNISFTCFNFLGLATTPAIARAYAKNDAREASCLIARALWVALASGLSATLMLSIFTRPILSFFGANAAILPHAVAYLRARIVAAPFFLAAMVGNGTFRGFQDTRTPLFVGLFANVMNLILYPTFIFAFKLGTRGAGMAFATGQICAGFALLVLLVRTGKLKLSDMRKLPQPSEIFPLLRTGAVLSVRTLSIYSTISYATATAARMGTIQVAAFEIGRQIFALFARLLDAISVAAQALVALAIGQDDYPLARRTANRILRIGLGMGCGFVALLMLIVNIAPSLFTSNIAVREMVKATFPYMAIIQPINGLVFVFDGIFTAGRKFSILSAAIFCAASLASVFLYFVRSYALPLQFVWLGLNIMMFLRASALGILYLTKWSPIPKSKSNIANGAPQ